MASQSVGGSYGGTKSPNCPQSLEWPGGSHVTLAKPKPQVIDSLGVFFMAEFESDFNESHREKNLPRLAVTDCFNPGVLTPPKDASVVPCGKPKILLASNRSFVSLSMRGYIPITPQVSFPS